MSWRHREPILSDYETQEEYESALAAYDAALDSYVEEYMERTRDY